MNDENKENKPQLGTPYQRPKRDIKALRIQYLLRHATFKKHLKASTTHHGSGDSVSEASPANTGEKRIPNSSKTVATECMTHKMSKKSTTAPISSGEKCQDCQYENQPEDIKQLLSASKAIESARRRTSKDPEVKGMDLILITGRLEPEEPEMSISQAQRRFQGVIHDIFHSSSAEGEGAEGSGSQEAKIQDRRTVTIAAVQVFVTKLLHHCDRELYLRRYFKLRYDSEDFVDIRQQMVVIQRLGQKINDTGFD